MSELPDVPRMLVALAADDELIARSLLTVEGVTDAGVGFHTQQAVEKSLKAVLALKDVKFPFTHDLNGLLQMCEKSGIDVPHDLAGAGALSLFAVRLRYDASPAAHLDRDEALKWAASAVEWARSAIDRADAR